MAEADQVVVMVPPELLEELEDLRTFLWLVAEAGNEDNFDNYEEFGRRTSKLLGEGFGV